ncbi:MAG: GNAT family N-acetyltransferase [Candidatus Latescibacteria bacterium]|nr:GNAT family N-acetyltransferase [Candidatus Latescibacterota bacterium]
MIRTYRPQDLETLKEITVICFEGVSIDHAIETKFGQFTDSDWKARKAKHVDADVSANPEGVFVFEENGKAMGYISTRIDHDNKVGQIPNLSVLPECRGKGAGKALMKAAFDYFEEQGMEVAKIETLAHNEVGQNFYPRSGFTEITRQIHYAMPLKDRKL